TLSLEPAALPVCTITRGFQGACHTHALSSQIGAIAHTTSKKALVISAVPMDRMAFSQDDGQSSSRMVIRHPGFRAGSLFLRTNRVKPIICCEVSSRVPRFQASRR